jgi:hypothetical protein
MKYAILLTLLCAGTITSVSAQLPQAAIDSARIAIRESTAVWNTAVIQRDSLTLENLLAPNYSLNGMVTRGAWMDNTLHHITTDTLELVGPLEITVYGPMAKSEGTLHWNAGFDANPKRNAEFAITDIWALQDGQWRVILRLSEITKMR